MVSSPPENVDNAYLPASATDELVIAGTGFDAPDGLRKRRGGFRARHAVVGQEVNSGLPECREPVGRGAQLDPLGGRMLHGYRYVQSAAVHAPHSHWIAVARRLCRVGCEQVREDFAGNVARAANLTESRWLRHVSPPAPVLAGKREVRSSAESNAVEHPFKHGKERLVGVGIETTFLSRGSRVRILPAALPGALGVYRRARQARITCRSPSGCG